MTEPGPQHLLRVEEVQTIARMDALTSEFDDIVRMSTGANADDEHDPEGSTLAFERARVSALLSDARTYLQELERAQGRIADGTYGACERCGTVIPRDRLTALPATRRCIRCQPASR